MTTLIININTFFPKLAAAAKLNNHARKRYGFDRAHH